MGQTRKCCVAVRALRPLDHSACRESCCLPISEAEKGYLSTWVGLIPTFDRAVLPSFRRDTTRAQMAQMTTMTRMTGQNGGEVATRHAACNQGPSPTRLLLAAPVVILLPITAKKAKASLSSASASGEIGNTGPRTAVPSPPAGVYPKLAIQIIAMLTCGDRNKPSLKLVEKA